MMNCWEPYEENNEKKERKRRREGFCSVWRA
jgi:hypothetical protein